MHLFLMHISAERKIMLKEVELNNSKKEEESPVQVFVFISGDYDGKMGKKKYPMPENYLSESELPKPLIELSKKNGWTNENGNVYFDTKWQPAPFFDKEKNITWILANNNTPKHDLELETMVASCFMEFYETVREFKKS